MCAGSPVQRLREKTPATSQREPSGVCHRACYSFSSERAENGKLRELVSEEDANSRGTVLKLPG